MSSFSIRYFCLCVCKSVYIFVYMLIVCVCMCVCACVCVCVCVCVCELSDHLLMCLTATFYRLKHYVDSVYWYDN